MHCINKLDKATQARLKPKIKTLSENPRQHGAIKLQGFDNMYRIRVGILQLYQAGWRYAGDVGGVSHKFVFIFEK